MYLSKHHFVYRICDRNVDERGTPSAGELLERIIEISNINCTTPDGRSTVAIVSVPMILTGHHSLLYMVEFRRRRSHDAASVTRARTSLHYRFHTTNTNK